MEYIKFIWTWLGENSAETIAFCALFFTAYQAYLSRTHNKISIKPHLVSLITRSHEDNVGYLAFTLINNGLGPAVIRSWKLLLDGKIVDQDRKIYEREIFHLLDGLEFRHSITKLTEDYAMPVNEKKDIVAIRFLINKEVSFEYIEARLNRLDLMVEYASMYGDKFTLDTRNS